MESRSGAISAIAFSAPAISAFTLESSSSSCCCRLAGTRELRGGFTKLSFFNASSTASASPLAHTMKRQVCSLDELTMLRSIVSAPGASTPSCSLSCSREISSWMEPMNATDFFVPLKSRGRSKDFHGASASICCSSFGMTALFSPICFASSCKR